LPKLEDIGRQPAGFVSKVVHEPPRIRRCRARGRSAIAPQRAAGVVNHARYRYPPLRDLGADGFDEIRQGVLMSGYTLERDVLVVVHAKAIKAAFPKNRSVEQCVSFVERNLEAFRGLVNGKLTSGSMEDFDGDGRRRRAGCLVEIDFADLTRSRRWLAP